MISNTYNGNNFAKAPDKTGFANIVTKGYNANVYGDVYLTGFFYIFWTRLPAFLTKTDVTNVLGEFPQLTRVLNNAVTLPDITLNTTTVITGFGGSSKLPIPTTIDVGEDLTIKYNELSGTPIARFHQRWISGIRDYACGLSEIDDYKIKNYTGDLLYITTKPVMKTSNTNSAIIETAHHFTNVFPTTDRQSLFSSSIDNSDKVELEITYKHGGMSSGESARKLAESTMASMMKTISMDKIEITTQGWDGKYK